jgi:hypothetical protein
MQLQSAPSTERLSQGLESCQSLCRSLGFTGTRRRLTLIKIGEDLDYGEARKAIGMPRILGGPLRPITRDKSVPARPDMR